MVWQVCRQVASGVQDAALKRCAAMPQRVPAHHPALLHQGAGREVSAFELQRNEAQDLCRAFTRGQPIAAAPPAGARSASQPAAQVRPYQLHGLLCPVAVHHKAGRFVAGALLHAESAERVERQQLAAMATFEAQGMLACCQLQAAAGAPASPREGGGSTGDAAGSSMADRMKGTYAGDAPAPDAADLPALGAADFPALRAPAKGTAWTKAKVSLRPLFGARTLGQETVHWSV